MTREEIEKSKKGKLEDIKCRDNLLVSFGGVQQGLGIPVFEFFNSISEINCDKIFLRDFQQAWYHKGVDDEINNIDKVVDFLNKAISNFNYKKICFLGNSMGGYAAILFGSILNVDKVISFAPQTFIDRTNRFKYFDTRWSNNLSKLHAFKGKKREYFDLKEYLSKRDTYKTELNIYFSSNHRLDNKHSERLKHQKNVILHPKTEGGHSTVKILRDTGELKNLIKLAFR